jgi:hypothetical protein
VRLFEHALLADENIHPSVVEMLTARGVKAVSVVEIGGSGASVGQGRGYAEARG